MTPSWKTSPHYFMYLGCFTILMLTPECWNQGSVGLLSIDDAAFLDHCYASKFIWGSSDASLVDLYFSTLKRQIILTKLSNLPKLHPKPWGILRLHSLHKSSALWRTNWLLLVVRIQHFDSSVHWTCCYFLHTFSGLKWGFLLIPHLNSGFLATSLT